MSPPGVPLASGWVRHGRARLNLAMRLATRAYQVLSIGGAGRGPVRGTLAAASAASDVALARRLARSDRPDLLRHWLVDAADLAVWTAAGDRPGPAQPSAALTPGHPLAIEAGARHGGYGLVVPVVNAAVMSAVQRLRGRPSVPGVVAWQVAAAVGGAGLARYARGLRARRLLGRETRLAAELSRTELAAQNDLALRLDNVVDEVQRAAVLLHLGGAADGAGPAGPWKADLAERTRRSHRYLVDALLAWQRRHNDTPRLADVVELVPAPDLAPVVLTAEAAGRLAAALDALSLRGRVPVALGSAAEEGSRVVLAVGPHLVGLDTGVTPVRMAFDPVPGGFAWMALWLAVALPQCAVPPAAALGPATGALGLMAWAHRTGRGATAGSRDALILASTALAVGSAAVQTRTMRAPHDDLGIPPMAVGLGLRGHAFVTALARPGLSTPALAVAWLGGATAAGVAWALTPRPRPFRELAAELVWVGMAATMARAFTEGIERDSAELEAAFADEDARRLAASADDGRRRAEAAVRIALAEAEATFARGFARLAPELRTETRRRLDLVNAQLTSGRAST